MLQSIISRYNRIRKATLLLLPMVFCHAIAFCQAGDGAAGIQKASTLVSGYFKTATVLLYAIGALVGIVGAVKVFNKWNSGDQDTSKAAASWFGSCIFLVVVTSVLSSFTGVS